MTANNRFIGYEEKRGKKKRKRGLEAKKPRAMLEYLDNYENGMDNKLIIRLIAGGVKDEMVRLKRDLPLL
jgi:hypothetical protein